jgi:hypothetical protein
LSSWGGEGKVTDPTRFRGTGTLLVKGAEQSPVEYEITLFEVDQVMRTEGWVEAGPAVLEYAQRASGAQLRLSDGRTVDISIGSFIVKGSPSRAQLIVHDGW